MSEALQGRIPDPSLVHCWARTHRLVSDVRHCMTRFAACGGNVTFNEWSSLATIQNMTSSHAACSSYFDKATHSKMLETEGPLIEKYRLGKCCSE